MAKKEFNLGDSLAAALGKVSESGTEQISYIPLERLVSDERNFYSMDGVEELAANIELIGLQQPLRVRPGEQPDWSDAPFYGIVSGHRRAAALRILSEENPERWKTVPCIVETAGGSPELEELRLIMANSDSRKMSSVDLAKQAERVTELLYKLKEQGIEFSGRMRDHVAEACKVSKTKLAELKVIQDKLTNVEIRWYWDNGKLNQSQAYAIAQAEPYVQSALCTYVGADQLPGYATRSIESKIRTIKKISERECKRGGELVEHCQNCDVMLDRAFRNRNAYSACEYYCCGYCPELTRCKTVCEFYREEAEKRKMAEKVKKAEERMHEKAREKGAIDVTRKIWTRFGELRRSKGLSAEDCCKARGDTFIRSYHGEDWHEEMEGPKAKITEHTAVPWTNSMQADDVEKLVKTADLFGVSTDYLLGRTDEKEPWAKTPWISCEERDPEEGSFVFACTRDGVVVPSVYFRASFMDFTERSVGNNRIQRVQYWLPLPAMPEGKKWQGQETLENIVGR